MATHPVVDTAREPGARNAERCLERTRRRVAAVLRFAAHPHLSDKLVDSTCADARDDLTKHAHVSINVSSDRLVAFLRSGILPRSAQSDIYSAMFRKNADAALALGVSCPGPIYGALNWTSGEGAAPAFSPDFWLRVEMASIEDQATFTARDSYNIVLPYFPRFELVAAQERVLEEVFTVAGVLECCLLRFWTEQDGRGTDYIEAQLWGDLSLDQVSALFVREVRASRLDAELRHAGINAIGRRAAGRLLRPFRDGEVLP